MTLLRATAGITLGTKPLSAASGHMPFCVLVAQEGGIMNPSIGFAKEARE
jgi:hypothetical protein